MKPKLYIATSLLNRQNAANLATVLRNQVEITFPWWDVRVPGTDEEGREEAVRVLGPIEERAVREADLLIALLPARRGGYVEIGIALGAGVPVAVFYCDEDDVTIPFLFCSGVVHRQRATDPDNAVELAVHWFAATMSHVWCAAECVEHGVFEARLKRGDGERVSHLSCPSCRVDCEKGAYWPATESGHGATGDGGRKLVWQTAKGCVR